jgi:hypothetical protein
MIKQHIRSNWKESRKRKNGFGKDGQRYKTKAEYYQQTKQHPRAEVRNKSDVYESSRAGRTKKDKQPTVEQLIG